MCECGVMYNIEMYVQLLNWILVMKRKNNNKKQKHRNNETNKMKLKWHEKFDLFKCKV